MDSNFELLKLTEQHMGRVRLPIARAQAFYPTEASVQLDELGFNGKPVIIGTCQRAAWYRYMGEFKGQAYTGYTYWIFDMGKAVEESVIELWKQMGLWVDNNVKFFDKEHNISGELDVILRSPISDESYIAEVKTYSGYEATKSIAGNKSTVGQPKDAHLLQTLIYLNTHKNLFRFAKLLYLDKTSKQNVEFTIELAKEGANTYPIVNGTVRRRFSIEQIYERFKVLQDYINKKELPPRDFELSWTAERIEKEYAAKNISKFKYENWSKKKVPIGDWNCRYCKYVGECYDINPVQSDEDEVE